MTSSTLQPDELDISVTWALMPSRTLIWQPKFALGTASIMSVSVLQTGSVRSRFQKQHTERQFVSPAASAVRTPAERWSYFRDLAASEMEWHGLSQQSWTVKYDNEFSLSSHAMVSN